MIKIVTYVRRNPNLTREEFTDYWKNVHAPLCKSIMPGLRKYVGSFPTGDKSGGADPDYDGVVDLYFDDVTSMRASLTSPQFNTEERKLSSAKAFDNTRTEYQILEEFEIPL